MLKNESKIKFDQLTTTNRELEENFEKQIKRLAEEQRAQLDEKRNEYSQKMLEDAANY